MVTVRDIRRDACALARRFDADGISPGDADVVVAETTAAINALSMVRTLAARRSADGGGWRRAGAKSPAHHHARTTGTGVGAARDALGAAQRLGALPELALAARRGELSPAQVAPIADAAGADPSAERRLIDQARRASLGELVDECARTKAAAEPDPEARHRAIHGSRFVRVGRRADGAGELHYRSTPEEVAEVFSTIQGFANLRFDQARREARREPEEAYLADGLLDMARAGRAGPEHPQARGRRRPVPTKVIVRIDWDAFIRGAPIGGEVCEIAGLGPVPVSVVRAMVGSGDAFLAAVVTKGTDIARVVHLGRRPTALQMTALQWMSPTCIAEGCNNSRRIESDHREDWARTKVTLVDWLDPLCRSCHDLKTRRGWGLVEGRGKRPMVAPDDPRHPRHSRRANSPPTPPRE